MSDRHRWLAVGLGIASAVLVCAGIAAALAVDGRARGTAPTATAASNRFGTVRRADKPSRNGNP